MVPAGIILPLGVVLFGHWSLGRERHLVLVREILELQLLGLFRGLAFEIVDAGDGGRPDIFLVPGRARRPDARPRRRRLRTARRRFRRATGRRRFRFRRSRGAPGRRGLAGPLGSGRFPAGRRALRNGFALRGGFALRNGFALRGGFALRARRPLPRRRATRGGAARRLPRCRFLLPGRRPGGLSRPSAPAFFRFHCHVSLLLSTSFRPRRIIQFRVCRGESG